MTYSGLPEILEKSMGLFWVPHCPERADTSALQMGAENTALHLTMNTAYCISNAVMLMEENKRVYQRDENPTTEATKQL